MPPDASPSEEDADRELLDAVGHSLSEAERALAGRLDYGRGCPRCCYGPFPVNALDARRLRRGLKALLAADPERGRAVAAAARGQAARFAAGFPGTAGTLEASDEAVEAFCARFAAEACPALDLATGRCQLYEWRPLPCRTFGPPVRIGEEELAPCDWCFTGTPEEARRATAVVDPEGREDAILTRLEARGEVVVAGETVIAFALADLP